MSLFESLHKKLIFNSRISSLTDHIGRCIPDGASVLDVGCGNGLLASRLIHLKDDIEIEGIDVLLRKETHIPVILYDGITYPFEDDSYDFVMLVDVLHHTPDPLLVLKEATRVARKGVIIKDHLVSGLFAWHRLKIMDWVGNSHQGVILPYNYWSPSQWESAFNQLDMKKQVWETKLNLYGWPFSLFFENNLHFVTLISKSENG